MDKLYAKAKAIKLLLLDVDGVLTNGNIFINDHGIQELAFHIQDGLGIKLIQKTGITVGIITGRQSQVVQLRAQMLGITHLYQGNVDKRAAYQELRRSLNLTDAQIAFVGDDLPDLPLLQQVGLSIAVANARDYIKNQADWCTKAQGGQGAVREVCEFIMQAQGTWDNLIREFYV